MKIFEGRRLLIATKHGKEKVIAPILEKELGVKCFVPKNFDSDVLGTFTGEIERQESALNTVKKKCILAMQLTDCDLAIASEGSFGAHPTIHFVPADEELLIFIDKKNELEILVREVSTDTNFDGMYVQTNEELQHFARSVKFPTHGLIVRKSKESTQEMVKGIITEEQLKEACDYFFSNFGQAFIETDMRAMYNPSRMKVIENATKKLVAKINSCCPVCNTPGFGITEAKKGLPCQICSFPTQSTISNVYHCRRCTFKNEIKYPNGKYTEDPMYCDHCNP